MTNYCKFWNMINRLAPQLRSRFYNSKVRSLCSSGSKDRWKHMKALMGLSYDKSSELQGLANTQCVGDLQDLANNINVFFISVSSDLPPIPPAHHLLEMSSQIPSEFTITVQMVNWTRSKQQSHWPWWCPRMGAQELLLAAGRATDCHLQQLPAGGFFYQPRGKQPMSYPSQRSTLQLSITRT